MFEFDKRDNDQRLILHLSHANGFPPESYRDLVAPLTDHYRVIMFPARPLWPEPPPPESLSSWDDMATDLIANLESIAPVIGVGHSMGGVSTMLASIRRPDLFRAIVLLDPVLLPRLYLRGLNLMTKLRPSFQFPLVKGALRRRSAWSRREEAFERFRPRAIFERWSDDLLWTYIDGITQSSSNGGIELRYSPAWEARIYQKVPLTIWRQVPQISVPAIVIRGVETNTFQVRSMKLWQQLRPDLPVISIPQTGHLLPMERPPVVAEEIYTFLKTCL